MMDPLLLPQPTSLFSTKSPSAILAVIRAKFNKPKARLPIITGDSTPHDDSPHHFTKIDGGEYPVRTHFMTTKSKQDEPLPGSSAEDRAQKFILNSLKKSTLMKAWGKARSIGGPETQAIIEDFREKEERIQVIKSSLRKKKTKKVTFSVGDEAFANSILPKTPASPRRENRAISNFEDEKEPSIQVFHAQRGMDSNDEDLSLEIESNHLKLPSISSPNKTKFEKQNIRPGLSSTKQAQKVINSLPDLEIPKIHQFNTVSYRDGLQSERINIENTCFNKGQIWGKDMRYIQESKNSAISQRAPIIYRPREPDTEENIFDIRGGFQQSSRSQLDKYTVARIYKSKNHIL